MNRNRRNLFLSLVFIVLFSFGWKSSYGQCGCNFVISLSSSEIIFDGAAKKVKPGDKICIASGTRTGISFTNIVGTKDKPVIITNMCDGKVTLKVPSNWGNGVEFLGSSFFRFTGSGNASEPIGIEIVGAGNKTGATHGMNLMGLSTNFEVDHVNVHDFGGVGIVAKTDPTCATSTWRGNFILKDISLHDNIVANTGVEGFYVGNSHYDDGVTKTCSGVSTLIQEHLVDGVLIYNNTVTNTGNEGIQVGAASNAVAHHNTITNAGAINSDPSQANSFQSGSGTQMTAYNNIMDGSKGYGVINLSGGGTYYNNIMMNNAKGAILLEDRNLRPTGFRVFNNTFLNNTEAGVWMYSTNPVMSYLYNNIIIDQNISNYRYVVLVSPGANKLTQSNNYTSHDINTVKFANAAAKNYHLLVGSPAIDAGKDVSSFLVNFDLDDKTRPKGTAFDIGAYEYQPSGPRADAGVDQSITLPTNSINLTGTGTSATGITSYQWTKKSGGAATLTNATTPNLSLSGLVAGTYVFEFQVTDASGFDFDQVTVNVLPIATNQNPKANAGLDQTITLPTNTITLNGIGTDPDGSIASYTWIKVNGPASATLNGSNTANLSLSALVEGVYTFQLTVTDDKGATNADQVTVTVNAATVNQVPLVNAGLERTLFLPTNQITIVATASDPDGSIASILWEKKSGGAATLTNTNTLSLGVAGLVLGSYTFRITVKDNKNASSFADVIVNVLQANQSPTANAGADQPLTLPTNFTTLTGSGTDPDGLIVSYLWTKVSGPGATLTGANTSILSLSNLLQGTYVFGLTVTDNSAATGYDEVVVAVSVASSGPNEVPLAISGGNVSFSLPVNSTNLYGSGFDPDGTIVSYSWSKASGGAVTLANANTPTLTVSNLTAGQYSFRLVVTDDKGATDDDIAIVTVSDAGTNIFPIASAGPGKIVKLPQNSVALAGSGTDADGQITDYLWTQVSGATATISSPSTPSTIISGLVEGDYSFRLTVTDNLGATDLDEVSVRVVSSSNNLPPMANAGPDVTLFLPQSTYTFDATASDDGAISTYQWSKLSGPSVTLINPTEENLSVKDLVQGDYTFQLLVTDNNAASVFDIVKVSVLPSTFKPPVVDAGDDQVIVLPIDQVSLTGTVSPSGSIVSTVWQKIVGPTATLGVANTLSLNVSNMVEGTYVFKLTATDNTNKEVSDNVQVIVKPIPPNQPPIVTAGINTSIILPTSQVTLTGTATDSDGTVASLKWTQIQGPSTATLQNASTLTLTASGLVQGIYIFRLTATDNSGDSGSNEVLVSVSSPISTEKQAPVVFAGDDVVLVDPDNEVTIEGKGIDSDGAIQNFVWEQLTGTPVDFTVSNQTIITIKGLSLGMYSFRLTATDDDQLEGFDDVNISVIEKNQEIPKFFSPNNDGVGEYWVFRNIDSYQQCKVSVFSRSGQVVYEAAPYHNDWNGTYNGKPLGDGDFYYNVKCGDGRVVTGALRIIR